MNKKLMAMAAALLCFAAAGLYAQNDAVENKQETAVEAQAQETAVQNQADGARLITRDLTPTAGTISVNGEAIGRFALRDFRKSVSLVPQRTAIINGTIMENITLGENCPDFNWLLSCCVSAGLGKFLEESPQGVFTKVGENGKLLSGGEIQKIALARAFYRRPAILILDEATSQMDAASRKDIGRRLADLSGNGVTVIVISHDNDFNTLADHIVDLDENDCAIAGQDCMPD